MKIVFLDIDGVLNHDAFYERTRPSFLTWPEKHIDPDAVLRLNQLAAPDTKFVISSSWRTVIPFRELAAVLHEKGFRGDVIGATPDFSKLSLAARKVKSYKRGHEIQRWLVENRRRMAIDAFVILDDCADMAHLRQYLVQTDVARGLTEADVDHALDILWEEHAAP